MKRLPKLTLSVVMALFGLVTTSVMAQTPTEPTARKQPKVLTTHGDQRTDNYYWLNDREDPEVIAYLEAENRYKDALLAGQKGLQQQLYDEIVARIKPDDESVPYMRNGYLYSTRYTKGQEYPIYIRRKGGAQGAEETMLDVNELAKPYDYYAVNALVVSPDNKLLAFAEDTLSRRIYTIRFKDLTTGELLPDKIEQTSGNVVWAADNKTVFYTKKDETLRAARVFRHRLGTSSEQDVEVYYEADPTFNLYLYKTKSDKYIVIHASSTLTTESLYLAADNPTGEFKVFEPRNRAEELEYSINHAGDTWYVRTNDKAENFKLVTVPEGNTNRENWQDLVPAREQVFLESFDVFKGYLALSERVDGIVRQRILPLPTAKTGLRDHYIDFGEDAYLSYLGANYDYDTPLLRVGFTSMTTPNTVYDYDTRTGKLTQLKQTEVLGDFSPENYQSERLLATARDGTKIPVSLVHHKDTPLDGTAPVLLYAYGSYGHSLDPTFSSVRLSLLDRGFVYAIAHIRGGQELGKQWYKDGKLYKKINTFTDFIDVADYLEDQQLVDGSQIYAMGGSAGGLLMGSVINMAPDRWAGVVAAVPFVDVVTTMLDETIPLTTFEYDEWGNPNEKGYYDYMLSYSPYDNVRAQDYPPLMVTTGLHDSQVQYWEPAKWVAKLRELRTNDAPLLLHTNMSTGHGGASGRFARYKEVAMEYAWLLSLAGKTKTLTELKQEHAERVGRQLRREYEEREAKKAKRGKGLQQEPQERRQLGEQPKLKRP